MPVLGTIKYCISAEFVLVEGYVKGTQRKEQHIAPFVECFNNNYFGKVSMVTINNASIDSTYIRYYNLGQTVGDKFTKLGKIGFFFRMFYS